MEGAWAGRDGPGGFRVRLDAFEWVDGEQASAFAFLGGAGRVWTAGTSTGSPANVAIRGIPHRGGLRKHTGDRGRRWHLPVELTLTPAAGAARTFTVDLELHVPEPGKARSTDGGSLRGMKPEALRALAGTLAARGQGGSISVGDGGPSGAARVRKVTCDQTEPLEGDEADRLVARLQYVTSDYPISVEAGKVVNLEEYLEQRRMLVECVALASKLRVSEEGRANIAKVAALVDAKASTAEVEAAARGAASGLAAELADELTPPEPAPAAAVAPLFATHCAACHGAQGQADGPAAATLVPPPANFHEVELTDRLSPLRAYHGITHGVLGTGMPSFGRLLSAEERWGLAFYVQGLRHGAPPPGAAPKVPIERLSVSSDLDLKASLPKGTDPEAALAGLRTRYLDAPRAPKPKPAGTAAEAPPSQGPTGLLLLAGLLLLGAVGAFVTQRGKLAFGLLVAAGAAGYLGVQGDPGAGPEVAAPTVDAGATVAADPTPFTVRLKGPRPVEQGLVTLYLTKTDHRMAHVTNGNEATFEDLLPTDFGRTTEILVVTSPELEATWQPWERFEVVHGVLELEVIEERPPFEVTILFERAGKVQRLVLEQFWAWTDDVTFTAFTQFAVAAFNAIRPYEEWVPGDAELRVLSVLQGQWVDPLTPVEALPFEDGRFVLVHRPLAEKMSVAELLDAGGVAEKK